MTTKITMPLAAGDTLYVYALKGGGADIGLTRAGGGTDSQFVSLDDAGLTIMIAQDLADQYGCVLEILPSAVPFLADADEARAEYALAITGAELNRWRERIDAA